MTLEEIIQVECKRATTMFNDIGTVPITLIGYRADGNVGFMFDAMTMESNPSVNSSFKLDTLDGTEQKQFYRTMAVNLLVLFGCTQMVQFSEAWAVRFDMVEEQDEEERLKDIDRIMQEGISNHPARVEVINYIAEDIDCNRWTGFQGIIRPKGFKPYLADLQALPDDLKSEGRFVNFYESKDLRDTIQAQATVWFKRRKAFRREFP